MRLRKIIWLSKGRSQDLNAEPLALAALLSLGRESRSAGFHSIFPFHGWDWRLTVKAGLLLNQQAASVDFCELSRNRRS